MSPKEPYGDRPMTSAERVRRARWVNRFEETAFKLMELLNEAPDPLPRQPEIPADLVEGLRPFISASNYQQARMEDMNSHAVRVLKLGNGNQVQNKKKALRFVASHFHAEIIDNKTVRNDKWGLCHVAAYTHPKGAMISTPHREDQTYGGTEWHKNDHVVMFRDVGDGRCKIYVNKIEPLFDYRTIGHHGVTWEDIEKLSSYIEVIKSQDVIIKLDRVAE
jgi:hypothetical protein